MTVDRLTKDEVKRLRGERVPRHCLTIGDRSRDYTGVVRFEVCKARNGMWELVQLRPLRNQGRWLWDQCGEATSFETEAQALAAFGDRVRQHLDHRARVARMLAEEAK